MRCHAQAAVCVGALLWWAAPAGAGPAPIHATPVIAGHPVPARASDVRLADRGVEVVFDGAGTPYPKVVAEVREDFTLVNLTDKPRELHLGLPVFSAAPWSRLRPSAKPTTGPSKPSWFRVTIDGRPVKARAESLAMPTRDRPGWVFDGAALRPLPGEAGPEQAARHNEMLQQWVQAMGLSRQVAEARAATTEAVKLQGAYYAFRETARKHLLDSGREHNAVEYVRRAGSLSDVARLIPEADPSLRLETPGARSPYVPCVRATQAEQYRPYAEQWRKKIDAWIASKPDLAKAADELRTWDRHARRRIGLTRALAKTLHDECGLSIESAGPLARRLAHAYKDAPPEAVMRELYRGLRKEHQEKLAAHEKLLGEWGLDAAFISPFTGRLYRPESWTAMWPGASRRAGEAPAPAGEPDFGPARGRSISVAWSSMVPGGAGPALIRCPVKLAARSRAKLSVQYSCPVCYDGGLYASRAYYVLPQLVHVLATGRFWKGSGPVSVRVVVPRGFYAVVLPAPAKVSHEKDRSAHRLTVEKPAGNLHVALLPAPESRSYSGSVVGLVPAGEENLQRLESLLGSVRHPAVAPLLRACIARMRCRLEHMHRAWRDYQALRKDCPHVPARALVFGQDKVLEANCRKTSEWVEAVSASPSLKGIAEQFRGTRPPGFTGPDRDELTRRIRANQKGYTTEEQKIAAAWLLCQYGPDKGKGLAGLVALGRGSKTSALLALRAINLLSADVTGALDFVLEHVRADPAPIMGDGTALAWRLHAKAAACLRKFTSPQAGPKLLKLLEQTRDAYLVQETCEALKQTGDPRLFAAVAERARACPGTQRGRGNLRSLVRVLAALDRKTAPAVIRDLITRHPSLEPELMLELSRLGDRSAAGWAIQAYNTAADRQTLEKAATALCDLDDPSAFAKLKYRRDAPKWTGERLASIVRRKGGDKHAFAFVEQYYLQHVKGVKAFHHCDVAYAFARLGDRRALPYLREIFHSTERKSDAAESIGDILLPRRERRSGEVEKLLSWIGIAGGPGRPQHAREEAIRNLLLREAAALEQILRVSDLRGLASPDASSPADRQRVRRLAYLGRFGEQGMRKLLALSDGCGLAARYNLGRLMSMFPPAAWPLLREATADAAADPDRRKTAILALGLARDAESVALLDGLAREPAYALPAVQALGRIGGGKAIAALRAWRVKLTAAGPAGSTKGPSRHKVLLEAIARAVDAVGHGGHQRPAPVPAP